MENDSCFFSPVQRQIAVFTDLDGTLLDQTTYSFDEALPALHLLRTKKIPLIFCSSKTSGEIKRLQKQLCLCQPFISENGGAIFIPHGYFNKGFVCGQETADFAVMEIGVAISRLATNLPGGAMRNLRAQTPASFGRKSQNGPDENVD